MGTHPIFESDFDCLTEMKADEIREILSIKKNNYNYELKTTDDFARKKKATKKYFEIKKILKEMNDAEIVSWYYTKNAEQTERQRKRDRKKETEQKPSTSETISTSTDRQKDSKYDVKEKPSSSRLKTSRKLADFADIKETGQESPVKRPDQKVREWLSRNNFGIADDTLHEEREAEDLSSSQEASILAKIEEQKLVISEEKAKKKLMEDERKIFKNSSGHQMYIKDLPFPKGVSSHYEKAKIENFLTEEEAKIEEEKLVDIYPRYNYHQEQRRTDNICDLIYHTVKCYKEKSRSQKTFQ